jgi:flagellar biosynthesis GTPase FlhF
MVSKKDVLAHVRNEEHDRAAVLSQKRACASNHTTCVVVFLYFSSRVFMYSFIERSSKAKFSKKKKKKKKATWKEIRLRNEDASLCPFAMQPRTCVPLKKKKKNPLPLLYPYER